ncbi:hypothetical protein IB279_02820 [Ensifer sp. ENS06]|uniref:hypothetical protein n=1 Tax=Ensifer sp. ENS06 TaxID=2769276 RepID=UPI001786F9BA|nr:hypothetical protein [Ensifer sp. ENS06]MBD9621871.1 hypothetical protein [Ensifer sp. ENS06]
MKLRELWDKHFWIVALILLEAVLLLTIFGLPTFCLQGEACGREIFGMFSGMFSGVVTAVSVVYLARQVAEARKQNSIAQSVQQRRVVSVAKRALGGASALKGTFVFFENFASAQPTATSDLATCIFRTKSALETICKRFDERAFDEFEDYHVCQASISTIRRTIGTSLETLESIYEAAEAGSPLVGPAYQKFLAQLNRQVFLTFLDEVAYVAKELLDESGVVIQ